MNNIASASQASPLAGLARKAQNNPRYMASVVSTYQKQEGFSQDKLLAHLQTNIAMLTRLSLCFRPDAKSSNFAQQVQQLASFTDIQPTLLAQMIRQVDSLANLIRFADAQTIEETAVAPTGRLKDAFVAARDRDDDEENQEYPTDNSEQS